MLLGIDICVMLVQSLNAYFPMLVTLSGIVMLERFLQAENAFLPIILTPSGIVTVVILLQFENASWYIPTTLYWSRYWGILSMEPI